MSDQEYSVSDESWRVWSKHVLMQIEAHGNCLNEIKKDISDLKGDIKVLKVKSGIWGLIGGAIPVGVALILWFIQQP